MASLTRPSNTTDLDIDLSGLNVTQIEESGEEDLEFSLNYKPQEGPAAGEQKKNGTGQHLATKSLADFMSVDEAVNHAVDNSIPVMEAFQQLEYRASQILLVNQGVLLRQTTDGPTNEDAPTSSSATPAPTFSPPPSSSSSSSDPASLARPVKQPSRCLPKSNNSKASAQPVISAPSLLKHKMHVQFNDDLCKYEGLSDAAAQSGVNQQFGIPLVNVPKRTLKHTNSKIPSVLVLLWNKVLEKKGETSMGLFRLAADADEMKWIKSNLNSGTLFVEKAVLLFFFFNLGFWCALHFFTFFDTFF